MKGKNYLTKNNFQQSELSVLDHLSPKGIFPPIHFIIFLILVRKEEEKENDTGPKINDDGTKNKTFS